MSLLLNILKYRRKRFIIICIAVIIIIYLLNTIVNLNWMIDSSSSSSSLSQTQCETTPEMRMKMNELLRSITESLQSLNVTYFLCYESLWGALKAKAPLKWHQSIDICLLNEEVALLDEAFLIRTFKRYGTLISYHSSDGMYEANSINDNQPIAKLYLFEEDTTNNYYRRVGWKNRLVPPNNCQMIHCFPPRLVSKPLPTQQFMSHIMPVPREEIEIQKYLFPDNWWKDLEPEQCKHNFA